MAEGEASSGLTIDDVREIYERAGPVERDCLRELLQNGNAREAMVFAQTLHYFPNARVVERTDPPPVELDPRFVQGDLEVRLLLSRGVVLAPPRDSVKP